MVHHPHRDLGDPRGKLGNLDPVKTIDIDLRIEAYIGDALLAGMEFLQHRDFEFAQFAIGDDEKISAAAGRIEKSEATEFRMKILQRPPPARILACLQPREFALEIVEKQRLNDLQNVFLAGVMGALLAAGNLVHDRLKQRAEDRGRDFFPIEAAGVQKFFAHGAVEIWQRQALVEKLAVDVIKAG